MLRVLVGVGLLCLAQTALADSYWNHNGSVMRLVAEGNQRYFYYHQPSDKMQKAGVYAGELLFDGTKQGNHYHGTARVFSQYCQEPLTYGVSGNVSPNQTKITLIGTREKYAKGCRATGKTAKDTLVFTYLYSD